MTPHGVPRLNVSQGFVQITCIPRQSVLWKAVLRVNEPPSPVHENLTFNFPAQSPWKPEKYVTKQCCLQQK